MSIMIGPKKDDKKPAKAPQEDPSKGTKKTKK